MSLCNIADVIREKLGDEAFIAWERQEIQVELPQEFIPIDPGALYLSSTMWDQPAVVFQGWFIAVWCRTQWVCRQENERLSDFESRTYCIALCEEWCVGLAQ